MAEEGKVGIKIDLDSKESIEKLLNLKNIVEKLGSSESLTGLIEGLVRIGPLAGALGATFYAVKTAIEATFEAENIKAINQQFEILTERAGVAGETLKNAMVGAAKGMVDDTELMKLANKAIVEFEGSAAKLPQVMELARKASAVTGQDMTANFEMINHAVATGSQRMLKQLGLSIDVKKATEQYAKSIGVATDSLNENGKKQAILNAVLEKGKAAYAGIDGDIKKSQNSWKQLLTTLDQIKEIFLLTFEKYVGPVVSKVISEINRDLVLLKTNLVSVFGDESEKARAQVENLTVKLQQQKEALADLQKIQSGGKFSLLKPFMDTGKAIDHAKAKIVEYEAQLEKLKEALGDGEEEDDAGTNKDKNSDKEKRLAQEAHFQGEMAKLHKERIAAEMETVTDLATFETIKQEEKLMLEQELAAKLQEIRDSGKLDDVQKEKLRQEAILTNNQKILASEVKTADERKKIYKNLERAHKDSLDGMAIGFKNSIREQTDEQLTFAGVGRKTASSFQSNFTDAFEKVGEGSLSMGEAMKSALLNALGDIAIAEGSLTMMKGVAEFPAGSWKIPVGAGLIAFGGYLKGQAKQASASGGGVSAHTMSGGGGSAARADSDVELERKENLERAKLANDQEKRKEADQKEAIREKKVDEKEDLKEKRDAEKFRDANLKETARETQADLKFEARMKKEESSRDRLSQETTDVKDHQTQRKTVTLQIQGNYFETEQTRTRLVDILREANDAQDFKFQQIGEGR